jgi:hypothetical protein
MKRLLILAGIAVVAMVAARWLWMSRATHAHITRPASAPAPGKVIVPAGTAFRVRLVEGISEGSKAGEILQGVTPDPVLAGTELAVPTDTRVQLKAIRIQDRDKAVADVTLQLQDLLFSDQSVPVHSSTVTTQMKRMSDIELFGRALGSMLGGAIGAARSASAGGNPGIGAGAVGGRQAGGPADESLVVFEIIEPIDLTGVAW